MTQVEYLSCREFVELVTAYLEHALPADERERFEQHLRRCAGCEIYVEQMRRTAELAGAVSFEGLPAEAEDELLHAFAGWRSARN